MKIKILYIITKADWGGAQRYVFDLASEAHRRGYAVTVAVGSNGALTEKLQSLGIRTILLPLRQHRTFIGDILTFGSIFSLIQLLRNESPDIVHTNSAKAGGIGALSARIARVQHIIFTAHGWEFNAPRNFLSKIGIRFFSWLTILLSHHTIAVSGAILYDVHKLPYVIHKIKVIYNGVSCTKLPERKEARAILDIGISKTYWIGMISELNPTKRVEDAIYSFSHILREYPDTVLVIFGDGRERDYLERIIHKLQLTKSVVLAGFRKDAPTLLRAFNLFIHTPVSEALGYAVLEAGCASLPVIATNVGGIPEIIINKKYGILVPPRDQATLAGAISSLLKDTPLAEKMGALLHKRVQKDFSKQQMLSKTFNLYTD